jgi:hypothetical protein
MISRNCYILTCDEFSDRTQFSKNILEKIGFKVNLFKAIRNNDKILSNKISMLNIYNIIANGSDEWVYVFEDDINILENISLDEIIKYESISSYFFYLGLCDYGPKKTMYNKFKINNNIVTIIDKNVRGLHAIALSRIGALKLFEFAKRSPKKYMDICLEDFVKKYYANVVRYDLESYIKGHRGIFYQDRHKFKSLIK